MSGASSASDLLPSGSLYSLPSNSSIELSFPMTANAPGQPHPFHLHGVSATSPSPTKQSLTAMSLQHKFWVVRSAGSDTYNYENPVQRDTVSTGTTGDNVTIRFTTDNTGPWFLHCHIDFHLEAGLAVVLVEDLADVNSTITPSCECFPLPPYQAQKTYTGALNSGLGRPVPDVQRGLHLFGLNGFGDGLACTDGQCFSRDSGTG